MAGDTLSKLFVRIGADTKDFQKNMNAVQKKMGKVGQGMTQVGKGMTKWVTGPIAAVSGAMLELSRRTGNYADDILDLEAATGHTTGTIQEYQAIAERAGTSTEAFTNASQTLLRQMSRGEEGSATLRRGLEELGLTYQQLSEASPDDRMMLLMDSLRNVESAGKRAQIGTKLLRNGYEELAPILEMSEEKMDDVVQKARESGKIMGEDALQEANQFREGLDELKQELTGIFRSIASDIIPVLNEQLIPAIKSSVIPMIRGFADTVSGLIEFFANLSPVMQKVVLVFTGLAAALGPVLIMVVQLITAISTIMPVIQAVGAVVAGIASGPLLVIAGVVAAVAVAFYKWEEILTFVKGFSKMVGDLISGLAQGVVKAFEFMRANTIGIFEGMWNGIKTVINFIIDGVNALINALNKLQIQVPDWVPKIGGQQWGFDVQNLPKLAQGGNISLAGSAIVGEEGPEVVELPRGAAVKPLNNEGNNRYMTINFGDVHLQDESDMDLLAEKIGRVVKRENRRVGV